ncbi:hypothetical protein Pelo_19525 [Pelomyxa schiedti]|nr:hypothetical protein Pelo_19525 [Pelomyxa schiedti]
MSDDGETNKVPDGTYMCTRHEITDDYGTGKTSNLAACMADHSEDVVWCCNAEAPPPPRFSSKAEGKPLRQKTP